MHAINSQLRECLRRHSFCLEVCTSTDEPKMAKQKKMYNLKFKKMNLTNQMISRGVEYTTSGDSNRAYVGSYHHCSRVGMRNLNICAPRDVVGLPRVEERNIIIDRPRVNSKFTIGFEIEKNRFHRNAVMEYPLLAGFEEDSSCGTSSGRRGYEAVTNILPLVAPSTWRNKVFNMFTQAEKIIDDRYSPSNTRCGGHMTIRVEGMTSDELMKRMRKFSGLFYAMFRYRLKNSYCSRNVIMRSSEEGREMSNPSNAVGGFSHGEKYSVVNQKRDGLIEYRLPSRITSVKQLMRRYEIMYQMVNFAVNKPNSTFTSFLKACRPTLRMMYKGNEGVSVEFIERLAVEMQKVIRTNKIHLAVAHFFHRQSNQRYTRQALEVVQSADRGESRDLRDHSRNMMIESIDDLRFE